MGAKGPGWWGSNSSDPQLFYSKENMKNNFWKKCASDLKNGTKSIFRPSQIGKKSKTQKYKICFFLMRG